MEKPVISIIVPVYNVEAYVGQCIESLVTQTYENIEIICINDGSTDKSRDILEKYASRDSRVKITDKENGGLSAARNDGLDIAQGEFILFVDSDDWIDRDMCRDMLSCIRSTNTDVCMCGYVKEFLGFTRCSKLFETDKSFDGNDFRNKLLPSVIGMTNSDLKNPQKCDVFSTAWAKLYKKSVIGNNRFIDTKKIGTEDWIFQVQVFSKASSVSYIDKPFYHYRKYNITSLTANYKQDLFEKWTRLYDAACEYLKESGMYDEFESVLNNKIAVTVLFLGLNEIKAKDGIIAKSKRLKKILLTNRYQKAYKNFDMGAMPVYWKIFFGLAKCKMTFLMIIMLNAIEFLRNHKIY